MNAALFIDPVTMTLSNRAILCRQGTQVKLSPNQWVSETLVFPVNQYTEALERLLTELNPQWDRRGNGFISHWSN